MKKLKCEVLSCNCKRLFISSLCIASLHILAACGAPSIRVPITRPADIYLKEPRKVLITNLNGSGGQQFASALTRQLVESGKFEVLDRARLEQKLMESNPKLQPTATQALTGTLLDRYDRKGKNRLLGREGLESVLRAVDTNLVGPDKQTIAAEMAKLVGGGYLISGEMTELTYNKKDSKGSLTKDSKGKIHQNFIMQATATAAATIQIVNLSTGAIVASKNIMKTAEKTTQAQDTSPPEPDKNELLRQAVNSAAADFVRLITPHVEYVNVQFAKTEPKLPETEQGINLARSGLWPEAAEQFNAAVKKSPNQGTWWNLGIAYEYSYKFTDAESAFKEASKLGKCDKCNWEMHNVRMLAENMKKLQEQGVK